MLQYYKNTFELLFTTNFGPKENFGSEENLGFPSTKEESKKPLEVAAIGNSAPARLQELKKQMGPHATKVVEKVEEPGTLKQELHDIIEGIHTVTKTDGTVLKSNGDVVSPNGDVTKPNGTILDSDGNVLKPNGASHTLGIRHWKIDKYNKIQKNAENVEWLQVFKKTLLERYGSQLEVAEEAPVAEVVPPSIPVVPVPKKAEEASAAEVVIPVETSSPVISEEESREVAYAPKKTQESSLGEVTAPSVPTTPVPKVDVSKLLPGDEIPAEKPTTKVHTVQSGDNLWNIVKKHFPKYTSNEDINHTVNEVAKLNNLENRDALLKGQELQIPSMVASKTIPDNTKVEVAENPDAKKSEDGKRVEKEDTEYKICEVNPGGSLWRIVQREFPHFKTNKEKNDMVNQLAKINNIQDRDVIHKGQILKIPKSIA